MGTKETPGAYDCLGDALPDEPFFVLLGRDRQAPALIRTWCKGRLHEISVGLAPESDRAKVEEARKIADAMVTWRQEHDGRWREPAEAVP